MVQLLNNVIDAREKLLYLLVSLKSVKNIVGNFLYFCVLLDRG